MFFNYDLNNKYTYLYDLSGDLLKKTLINLTNNVIIKEYNYSYTNSNWEDQLTIYDGNSIIYDSIGNMISFDGATYTWTNGVELSLYSNNDTNTNVSYKYDDKGIRYYKNINNTDINYYTLNSDILYEVRGNDILYYLYTATSYGISVEDYGGISREIRNYDKNTNPMTLPSEIYNSPNTVKMTTVMLKRDFIEISKNEVDDNMFIGLSIDSADIGLDGGGYFNIKVGFNIDVSWLQGYKNY